MLLSIDNNKRIRILSQDEIHDLYEQPKFTDDERKWYFELDNNEQELLILPITMATKVDLILQLGYFKTKNQFFKFKLSDVKADADYIVIKYFNNERFDKISINREGRRQNQQRILNLLGYQAFSKQKHEELLLNKARKLTSLSTDPVFIFRELLDFIYNNKITLPGYTTFQDIISNTLSLEQQRIEQILKKQLQPEEKQLFLNLLQRQEGLYAVTLLKKQPKNFKPKAISQEVDYYQNYKPLYLITKRLLPRLGISKNSIIYFASLVGHYTVQGLSRLNQGQACLWLICFIYHRCRRMIDNLAKMFDYTFNKYQDNVVDRAHELLLADTLDKYSQNISIAKLLRLYIDSTIDGTQPFDTVKEKAYAIIPPETINQISCNLEKKSKTYQAQFTWQAVDQLAGTYKPVLRALLKVLSFESEQHKALQNAIYFLTTVFLSKKPLSKISYSKFPKQFIHKKISCFIFDKNEQIIQYNCYEYLCYQQIVKYLDAGSLFLNDSTKYRSLSSELISQWPKTKSKVLRKLDNPRLNHSFDKFIHNKAKPLDEKITTINEAICEGNNSDVKIKTAKDGSTSWTLPYTRKSIELNNPFYSNLSQVSIIRVLRFVNQQTLFMNQFTHIKPHYAKAKHNELATYACLIANGTNLGILKMADICDLSFSSLNMTDKNYIRLPTLKAANEAISNSTAALPIFNHWNFQADLLHASLDGQKFKTQRDTLLARYSKKYFGFDKGVVAYTMIANHVPVNAKIIGANEHESHFLFDLVYNNTTEIQPDIFSTDTEGTNQLNFLLLYMIERIFAPRYRSLVDKTTSIVSFSNPEKFKDCLIRPQSKTNCQLILDEEDNVKHILASLLVGETNQSNIIGKLSGQNFKSRTKRALWEMNAILMSDYLLDYIGDIVLRQSVQGALNRVEAYHQLRRHIAIVNGKNFRGSSEMEIAVWNECARLLANSIIYYNAMLLTKLMDRYNRHRHTEYYNFIKRLSPVAWTHINFFGQYEFLTEEAMIDIDDLLKRVIILQEKDKRPIKIKFPGASPLAYARLSLRSSGVFLRKLDL